MEFVLMDIGRYIDIYTFFNYLKYRPGYDKF